MAAGRFFTLGIDNISLMWICRNRGNVMDLVALTDDGYCGLKPATKAKAGCICNMQ